MVVVLPEPAHASTIKLSFEWSSVSMATCCSGEGGNNVRDLTILGDKASDRSGASTGAVAAATCARRLDPAGSNNRELVHDGRRGIVNLTHGVRYDNSPNLRDMLSRPGGDVLVALQHASIDPANMLTVAHKAPRETKQIGMLAIFGTHGCQFMFSANLRPRSLALKAANRWHQPTVVATMSARANARLDDMTRMSKSCDFGETIGSRKGVSQSIDTSRRPLRKN